MEEGRLSFRARTNPPIDRVLETGDTQAIPPAVEHEVEPEADARLFVEFLEVVAYGERRGTDRGSPDREDIGGPAGGDPTGWLHLVCPECGNVSGGHHPGCGAGGTCSEGAGSWGVVREGS